MANYKILATKDVTWQPITASIELSGTDPRQFTVQFENWKEGYESEVTITKESLAVEKGVKITKVSQDLEPPKYTVDLIDADDADDLYSVLQGKYTINAIVKKNLITTTIATKDFDVNEFKITDVAGTVQKLQFIENALTTTLTAKYETTTENIDEYSMIGAVLKDPEGQTVLEEKYFTVTPTKEGVNVSVDVTALETVDWSNKEYKIYIYAYSGEDPQQDEIDGVIETENIILETRPEITIESQVEDHEEDGATAKLPKDALKPSEKYTAKVFDADDQTDVTEKFEITVSEDDSNATVTAKPDYQNELDGDYTVQFGVEDENGNFIPLKEETITINKKSNIRMLYTSDSPVKQKFMSETETTANITLTLDTVEHPEETQELLQSATFGVAYDEITSTGTVTKYETIMDADIQFAEGQVTVNLSDTGITYGAYEQDVEQKINQYNLFIYYYTEGTPDETEIQTAVQEMKSAEKQNIEVMAYPKVNVEISELLEEDHYTVTFTDTYGLTPFVEFKTSEEDTDVEPEKYQLNELSAGKNVVGTLQILNTLESGEYKIKAGVDLV